MQKHHKTRTSGVYWVELKNGRRSYVATWIEPDGRRVHRRRTSYEKAKALKQNAESRIRSGDYVSDRAGKILFASAAGDWFSTKEAGELKPKTVLGYQNLLSSRILPNFGHRPVGNITPREINAWLAAMKREGLSGSRRLQAFRVVSAVLAHAVNQKTVADNPAASPTVQVPRKNRDKKRIALTHEQVTHIVESFEETWHPLILMLSYTGLRFSEAAALRRKAVHLERGQIRVQEAVVEVAGRLEWGTPKSDQARDVDLPAFLVA